MFKKRKSIFEVEEGKFLSPKFDSKGLIPVITTDYKNGNVLMHGYMNKIALKKTIETKEAHYWSRSRKMLWHKGKTSGFVQKIKDIRIDDDQDAVWLKVDIGDGASCHVGYKSCFYRSVSLGKIKNSKNIKMQFKEKKRNLILIKFIKISLTQQNYKMKILSPFGPKIAQLKFPSSLIKKINKEVDRISFQKKLIKKYDYSRKLVGQVKQEIQLSKNFIKKNILRQINIPIKKYIKFTTGKNTKTVKIKNFWVVSQFSNEYNPVHYHDGHVSGVGYLKIPKFMNKGKKALKTNGTIDFINGNKMFLNNSIFNHNPKVGDMLLFPNYLMHTAYPFQNSGERRSFSFNVEIDNNITNVFRT